MVVRDSQRFLSSVDTIVNGLEKLRRHNASNLYVDGCLIKPNSGSGRGSE